MQGVIAYYLNAYFDFIKFVKCNPKISQHNHVFKYLLLKHFQAGTEHYGVENLRLEPFFRRSRRLDYPR
jgi:hypothetical protein